MFTDHFTTHDHDLDDYPQACVDGLLTTDRSRRLSFLRWLKRDCHLTRVRLSDPAGRQEPGHDVDPSQQLHRARQLLHDPDSASAEDRAAACLILLYAQPSTKIAALTTHDIQTRDDDSYLTLGREPLLLVPPLDALLACGCRVPSHASDQRLCSRPTSPPPSRHSPA